MAPNLSTLRPLIAGDVITDDKPILHIIYQQFKGRYCDKCLKESKQLKKCMNCHQMWYCGTNCQQMDGKYHNIECKVLADHNFKANQTNNWIQRLLIRLWLTIRSDKTFATKGYQLFDGSVVRLSDMEVNVIEIVQNRDQMIEFKRISTQFRDYGIVLDLEFLKLLHWFGFVITSATIYEFMSYSSYIGGPLKDVPTVGLGIYPQLYGISHSCKPNSGVVTNGLSLQLRAMKPIAIGSQITRSYISVAQNNTERQHYLLKHFMAKGCVCHICKGVDSPHKQLLLGFEKQLKRFIQFQKIPDFGKTRQTCMKYFNECTVDTIASIEYFGQFSPFLTETLIMELMVRQIFGLCIQGVVGDKYYQRLEEHIRVTYGVNHPLYIQTHKQNPFFVLDPK